MHRIDYSRLRFLVASGEVLTRDTLRTILHAYGAAAVYQARDGFEALDVFSSAEPDIVFADREMALVGGLELTRLIRLTETTGGMTGNPYAPLVLVARELRREAIREAADAGVTEYLVKPISARTVYKLVEGVVLDPRPFIQLDTYFGPDRRRGEQRVDGDRRARRSEPDSRRVLPGPQGPVIEDVYGDHVVVRPPNALCRRAAIPAGEETQTRVSVIERAEAALAGLQEEYQARMASELDALQGACAALMSRPALASARGAFAAAADQTRLRAQDFGFVMAERIAAGLSELLVRPGLDFGALKAVECHVDALRAVLSAGGSNEGDALVDTMVAHLGSMTAELNPDRSQAGNSVRN